MAAGIACRIRETVVAVRAGRQRVRDAGAVREGAVGRLGGQLHRDLVVLVLADRKRVLARRGAGEGDLRRLLRAGQRRIDRGDRVRSPAARGIGERYRRVVIDGARIEEIEVEMALAARLAEIIPRLDDLDRKGIERDGFTAFVIVGYDVLGSLPRLWSARNTAQYLSVFSEPSVNC